MIWTRSVKASPEALLGIATCDRRPRHQIYILPAIVRRTSRTSTVLAFSNPGGLLLRWSTASDPAIRHPGCATARAAASVPHKQRGLPSPAGCPEAEHKALGSDVSPHATSTLRIAGLGVESSQEQEILTWRSEPSTAVDTWSFGILGVMVSPPGKTPSSRRQQNAAGSWSSR